MSNHPGLVASLFDGMGLPVKRIAQVCLVLLALTYWLAPATFQAGLNAWIQVRADQITAIMTDYIEQITSVPPPGPATPSGPPVAPPP